MIRMLSTITATDRDASSGLLVLQNYATSVVVEGKISTNRVRDIRICGALLASLETMILLLDSSICLTRSYLSQSPRS